jgi:hypothetical protein
MQEDLGKWKKSKQADFTARDDEIRERYQDKKGPTMPELAVEYGLTVPRISQIIRTKKPKTKKI